MRKFSETVAGRLDESLDKGLMIPPHEVAALQMVALVGIGQSLVRIADALDEMNQMKESR